jgi:hypothetical protein
MSSVGGAQALLRAAFVLALGACANSEAKPAADAAAPLTCQQIRLCVFNAPCAAEACVATCAAKGSSAAQSAFEALRACTADACAANDLNCACSEQCLANGRCLAEADACLGDTATPVADDVCDQICA